MLVIRSLLLLVMVFIVLSCRKEVAASTSTEISSGVNVNILMKLVNAQRSKGCKCGTKNMPPVPALSWNKQLEKAAYDHSVDMSSNNYFDHTAPGGSDPGMRISATGYVWITCAENIAEGYTEEQAVINGWLTSEGHCRNMMGAPYKEMGVGRSGNYWTMVVASSK